MVAIEAINISGRLWRGLVETAPKAEHGGSSKSVSNMFMICLYADMVDLPWTDLYYDFSAFLQLSLSREKDFECFSYFHDSMTYQLSK